MIWWIAGYLTLAAGFYVYAAITAEPDPHAEASTEVAATQPADSSVTGLSSV